MTRARCISERKLMPNQIKVGNEYWIDESTAWKDHDGDEYAQVYLDKDKEHRVGGLLTSHFETLESNSNNYYEVNKMVKVTKCINVYSDMNTFDDFCIIVSDNVFEKAEDIVCKAYIDWWELSDVEFEPILDYVCRCLDNDNIEYDIYLKTKENL